VSRYASHGGRRRRRQRRRMGEQEPGRCRAVRRGVKSGESRDWVGGR
jgi:hypothetical protein